MKTVVLVGCGELGSRHLQALACIEFPLVVHVLDPSEEALAIAKQRCEQVTPANCEFRVRYHTEASALSGIVDVAIIATTSSVRLSVLEELSRVSELRNVILEKFLFSDEGEYERARVIIEELPGSAWVNCPRRMYPVYQELKRQLPTGSPLHYSLSGPNWGLACNSIHFIDHLAFLTGETLEKCWVEASTARAIESKRSGYQEFLGEVRGEFSAGSTLSLVAGNDDAQLLLSIKGDGVELSIDEVGRTYSFINRDTGITETKSFTVPYQSQLSHLVVADIVTKGACDLPSYSESSAAHILLLRTLLKLHSELGGDRNVPLRIT